MFVDPAYGHFGETAKLDYGSDRIGGAVVFRKPTQIGQSGPPRKFPQKLEIGRLDHGLDSLSPLTFQGLEQGQSDYLRFQGHGWRTIMARIFRFAHLMPNLIGLHDILIGEARDSCSISVILPIHLKPFELGIERLIMLDSEKTSGFGFVAQSFTHRFTQVLPSKRVQVVFEIEAVAERWS